MNRWLIIQSDGEHKGQDGWTPNWYMRECYGLKDGIEKTGDYCDIWGKRHLNYHSIPDFNSYDYVVVAEQWEFDFLPDFRYINKPIKLQWIVDLHFESKHYPTITPYMDIVLHSTSKLIDWYSELFPNKEHFWFPNAVDEKNFMFSQTEKEEDLIFVGNVNKYRREIIEELEKDLSLKVYFLTGVDMVDKIRKSKIHFNKCIQDDLNYRIFETIGLGTCLITNNNPDLASLGFIDGVNCLLYSSIDECKHKINTSLKLHTWESVGKEGAKLAKLNTYYNRILKLKGIL